MLVTTVCPYGVPGDGSVSGIGAPAGVKIRSVPCSALQPPACDIIRYFSALLCTSRIARSSMHGCDTACSMMKGCPVCDGPPREATVIREGYGDPAPVFPISGTAI